MGPALSSTLREALAERVVLLDGAMGTEIQKLGAAPSDFPDGQDGFNDGLVRTHPEWIRRIHDSYLAAGADCIETNTFGSNEMKLAEYGMAADTEAHNCAAAGLARDAADAAGGERYVIGTMGPTGMLPSSADPDLGRAGPADIRAAYAPQAAGLLAGGADALLIETGQDILEVKAAADAALSAVRAASRDVPVIANVTLDRYGKMLLGTGVQAAYTTLGGMRIDAFGLNCSTGPAEMEPSIAWLDANSSHPLLVVPNAGMPRNEGGTAVYGMRAGEMSRLVASLLGRFARIRMVGGCCGTTPEHVAALRRVLDSSSQ